MAKRIRRKRTKGYKMPVGAIYVGRPTKYGNPFKVGTYINAWGAVLIAIESGETPDKIDEMYMSGIFDEKITLENSLKWYEIWLKFMIDAGNLDPKELRGHDLACFCPLDKPCHADILLRYANQ